MVKGFRRLKSRLAELYRQRRELEDSYKKGMYGGPEMSRRKSRINAEIAVVEHKMEKGLLAEKRRLHVLLRKLNEKHRNGEVEADLYMKGYTKIRDRLDLVEDLLSDLESGRGLYDYIRRDKDIVKNIRTKRSFKRAVINLVSFAFVVVLLALFATSVYDLFHVDTEAIAKELNISPDGTIKYEGVMWSVSFESDRKSTYQGRVRHACRYRSSEETLFTHDVLITSGDYADEDKVKVDYVIVEDKHGFRWSSQINPKGEINLLHVIPVNYEIYKSVDRLKKGDNASITGYEIAKLENTESGKNWVDEGCNSLYVTNVRSRSS